MRKYEAGLLTIGRIDSEETFVRIRLVDNSCSLVIVDIELKPEELGLALTGASNQRCRYELVNPEMSGYMLETKHEVVCVPECNSDNDDNVKRALLPHEVDGWKADFSSALNPHNWVEVRHENGFRKVRVLFRRYVAKDQ